MIAFFTLGRIHRVFLSASQVAQALQSSLRLIEQFLLSSTGWLCKARNDRLECQFIGSIETILPWDGYIRGDPDILPS